MDNKMGPIIVLFSACLIVIVGMLIWMNTKAGKEWLKNL